MSRALVRCKSPVARAARNDDGDFQDSGPRNIRGDSGRPLPGPPPRFARWRGMGTRYIPSGGAPASGMSGSLVVGLARKVTSSMVALAPEAWFEEVATTPT
jgi:hypothetical protein